LQEGFVDAMKAWVIVEFSILAAAVSLSAAGVADRSGSDPPAAQIERGRYLVHDVAMCVQCHSPRDESGALIETKLLSGAPMPVRSPFPGQTWAAKTPDLRGLNFLDEKQAINLLCNGIAHTGLPPQPPMPPFRMTRDDALAVYAYLKSLP
jgi:hypothetical protein